MENSESLHKRKLDYSSDQGFAWEKHNHDPKEIHRSTDRVFIDRQQNKISQTGASISGQTIDWYLSKIWPAVVGWLAVSVVLQFFIKYVSANPILNWLISGALFVFFCLILATNCRGAQSRQVAVAGMLFGFFGCLLVLLYDLVINRQFVGYPAYFIKFVFTLAVYAMAGAAATHLINKSSKN